MINYCAALLQCQVEEKERGETLEQKYHFDLSRTSAATECLTLNRVKHKVRFIKYPQLFLLNPKMSCIFLMLGVIPVLRLRYQDKIFLHF